MPRSINITFVDGDRNGESVSVPFDAPFTAGRDGGDAVRFREKAVSRGHFTVTPRGMRAEIVNNGKNPTEINGRPLAKGETCTAGPGDTLMVRYPSGKSGFRIDSITNGADDGEIAADSRIAADATVAYPAAGLTKQTAFGSSVMDVGDASGAAGWSRSVNSAETAKDETRVEDAGFTEAAPSGSGFGGSAAGYDVPTRAEAGTGSEDFEKITGPAEPADSETVNLADSPSGDGVTNEIKTMFLNANMIEEEKKRQERKKRTRRKLLAFAVLGFMAFIGAIVWLKWPKTESWLGWPVKPGEETISVDAIRITGADFSDFMQTNQIFVLLFPAASGYRVENISSPGVDGKKIETYVGKEGDVRCHIRIERRTDNAELSLTACESATAALSRLKERMNGFVIYEHVPEWGANWGFLETDYPKSFHGETKESLQSRRGIKYYKCEYGRIDGQSKTKWRGAMIMFRRGNEQYMVMGELPEKEWPRGKWLIRDVMCPLFQQSFFKYGLSWDFAGKQMAGEVQSGSKISESVFSGISDSALAMIIKGAISNRQNWPAGTCAANALLSRTWANPAKAKQHAEAALLWRQLESAKEVFYNSKKNAFDAQKIGSKTAKDIRDEVENAFKFDYGNDMRAEIVNDPEVWPCGKSRKKQ